MIGGGRISGLVIVKIFCVAYGTAWTVGLYPVGGFAGTTFSTENEFICWNEILQFEILFTYHSLQRLQLENETRDYYMYWTLINIFFYSFSEYGVLNIFFVVYVLIFIIFLLKPQTIEVVFVITRKSFRWHLFFNWLQTAKENCSSFSYLPVENENLFSY